MGINTLDTVLMVPNLVPGDTRKLATVPMQLQMQATAAANTAPVTATSLVLAGHQMNGNLLQLSLDFTTFDWDMLRSIAFMLQIDALPPAQQNQFTESRLYFIIDGTQQWICVTPTQRFNGGVDTDLQNPADWSRCFVSGQLNVIPTAAARLRVFQEMPSLGGFPAPPIYGSVNFNNFDVIPYVIQG